MSARPDLSSTAAPRAAKPSLAKNRLRKLWRLPFGSRGGQILLGVMIACYIHLVFFTARVRRQVHPEAVDYVNGEKPAIFAFWHGRMLLMPRFSPPGRTMWVMISTHRDGQWIALAMRAFRFSTVRGSSRRGGHSALRNALGRLQAGHNVAITPDGPRGPFEVAQPGAVKLAAMSGVPVLAVSFASNFALRASSWDRFIVAFPFSRLGFVATEPLFVDAEADDAALQQATLRLTERLSQASRQADRLAVGAPLEA